MVGLCVCVCVCGGGAYVLRYCCSVPAWTLFLYLQPQYIELSTQVDPTAYLYGAGERSSETTHMTVGDLACFVVCFFLFLWRGWWQGAPQQAAAIRLAHQAPAPGSSPANCRRASAPCLLPFWLQRNGYPYTLWARDQSPQVPMRNTYSHWPFVMVMEQGETGVSAMPWRRQQQLVFAAGFRSWRSGFCSWLSQLLVGLACTSFSQLQRGRARLFP